MTEIILDVSANTHRNDGALMKKIMESVPKDLNGHTIVWKTQMWHPDNECARVNRTCTPVALEHFIQIANKLGYKATSSVFDEWSLAELLKYDVPFVKIACRPALYYLIGRVPRKDCVYVSLEAGIVNGWLDQVDVRVFLCVPEYPADLTKYVDNFDNHVFNVSDHTVGLDLWHGTKPLARYECHYVLTRDDPDNPDAGPFAKTPEDLQEMING